MALSPSHLKRSEAELEVPVRFFLLQHRHHIKNNAEARLLPIYKGEGPLVERSLHIPQNSVRLKRWRVIRLNLKEWRQNKAKPQHQALG